MFWKIYNQLQKELQEKTYFSKLNKEHTEEDYSYRYDFVILNKICIEFNGEHVHPIMTKEKWNKWSIPYKNNKMNAIEKYYYDQIKLDVLRNREFKVLEVWYSDYMKNPGIIVKQCLDFIDLTH